MKNICSNCGEEYFGKSCKCQKGTDYQCAFTDHGTRCNKSGSISIGLGGKWYCRWHYHCLTSGVSNTDEEAYKRFKEKDDAFREKYSAKKATPEQIARFLITMGSKSVYWQKASEGVKQYALNYHKSGLFKPYNASELGVNNG